MISGNFILRNYPELKLESLNQTVSEIFDTVNTSGSRQRVADQIEALKQTYLSRNGHGNKEALLKLVSEHTGDVVILKAFNSDQTIKGLKVEEHLELFKKLSGNLKKNQKEVRLQTLKILAHKFVKLESKLSTEEEKIMCDVLEQMLVFEETDISFVAEKAKILQIDRIQSQLDNGSVPAEYLQTCFDFLVGVYWIKFTPLFEKTQQTIQILVREHPQVFAPQLFTLIENVSYLTQLAHDNQTLLSMITHSSHSDDKSSLVAKAYSRDSLLQEDFMDVKDFFYNISKSLCIATVMENGKDLRPRLFSLFYSFIDCEYTTLYLSKSVHNVQQQSTDKLLDQMTYANMVDSEEYRKYRRIAYSKLYCFLEML